MNEQQVQDSMTALDAIYQRRSVRDYKPTKLDDATIRSLLNAAVHAPTATHEEPWAFAVIQDQELLNRLSDTAKALAENSNQNSNSRPHRSTHPLYLVRKTDFHVFHNARTLIVIYGKFEGQFVAADCWLAAQNLMLAACAKGMGTCVVGFAVWALNTPQWKAELGIPPEMTAIAPVIVGLPAGQTLSVPRQQPDILFWK